MERILIIDDCRVMRDLLSEFLQEEGFEVFSTEDPEEAVEELDRRTYSLCICDMHLTYIDGMTVVQQLEARYPDLRFIITDSLPDQKAVERIEASEYAYIHKPFELDQIRQLIQHCLQPTRQTQ
ncbi:MAG: response regulator [candidate division Zixibacteria bacterium]|jgi:DNA-binding NtrC family response regulator|nr:response regulator [candidate division Zixibacteria bacterium]